MNSPPFQKNARPIRSREGFVRQQLATDHFTVKIHDLALAPWCVQVFGWGFNKEKRRLAEEKKNRVKVDKLLYTVVQ